MQRLSILACNFFLITAGCGDDGRNPPPGGGSDGSTSGADGGGGMGADGPVNSEGPVVEVTTPTAPEAGDFSSAAIVTGDSLQVLCEVSENAMTETPIDVASVVISASSGDIGVEAQGLPTGNANEFAADLELGDIPNGALTVRCQASDIEERENSDDVATFLDHGPKIKILAPLEGSRLSGQMNVVFSVTADPVAMGDGGADPDVSSVSASIGGTDIGSLSESGGVYTATVVFDDDIFDPELDGEQTLTVEASNKRMSTAVTSVATADFVVDNDGPTIDVTDPQPGDLISGFMKLTATIADPSGIKPSSVQASIVGNAFALIHVSGNTYEGTFDTRLLGTNMVFPNIIVRARDSNNNESSYGFVVALDNVSPLGDLDSVVLREGRANDGGDLECSDEFDPLGDDAVSDTEAVPQLFEIRARVEDFGNGASSNSGVILPVALVDPNEVELYILDNSSAALIVDTDGDGDCDAINPTLEPTSVPSASDEVARIDLVEIAPKGNSSFLSTSVFVGGDTYDDTCIAGSDEAAAAPVCVTAETPRIIRREIDDTPVIYGVPPLTELSCMGNALDSVATNLADGWVCAAVRSRDNLGNIGISPVLRFCIDADDEGAGGECHDWGTTTAAGVPDCTGTYDKSTGNVTGTCTPPGGFEREVRRIDL